MPQLKSKLRTFSKLLGEFPLESPYADMLYVENCPGSSKKKRVIKITMKAHTEADYKSQGTLEIEYSPSSRRIFLEASSWLNAFPAFSIGDYFTNEISVARSIKPIFFQNLLADIMDYFYNGSEESIDVPNTSKIEAA